MCNGYWHLFTRSRGQAFGLPHIRLRSSVKLPPYTFISPTISPASMPPDPLKPGRFVIRHRRGADNSVDEDSSITRLCTLLQLDKNHTSHLGTTKTEEYIDIAFDYRNPEHTIVPVYAFKRNGRELSLTAPLETYINNRI